MAKEKSISVPSLSNPFSTSGGGVTFEQLVGASYLVSLLACDIPRGLDWGITNEVKFQHRWSGCLLDDIVITGTDGSRERKIALQVKHDLTFSDSATNTVFARVIEDCWKTFTDSLGWKFNKDTDRLGIGIGVYQNKVATHFQPLLEWARTSKNSAEFIYKVSLSKFSSKEKQDYLQLIRNLLTKAKGSEITDDEIWRFLRCLVIIHFDLENAGSSDSNNCWNRLLDQLKSRDESQTKLLFNALKSIVEDLARFAGSIDVGSLRNKIPKSLFLKDSPNFLSDLNYLRKHSDTVLESIPDTIGLKIHLPRIEIINQLEASIKENDVVVISGEPMVGKSVLLKLLANRLRFEGEVIVFSVERIGGTTLENFLHNINIQNDFQTVLSAFGNAPLRCILIDGLEQAIDDDRKRVLNDLIIAVRKYNESILAKGGHRDYFWRIVFTCRSLEARNLLSHLETRRNIVDNSLKIVEVKGLNDEEVAEVVTQFTGLKDLASKGHLKEILSRPLILDILTLPGIELPSESIPPTLSESWLFNWFWKEVIRLADGSRKGRGTPDKREHLLISTVISLIRDGFVAINNDFDFEAVSGLVSDRILVRENDHLRFAHDIYRDWTLTTLLKHNKDEITRFLIDHQEQLYLVRPFGLYSSRILEVDQSPSDWLNLLSTLENEHILSPRWYQLALTAPLFSPQLKDILPQIQSCLFDNNGALLINLLKSLRIFCVQPNPNAYIMFGDLPKEEFKKYLAYMTIPLWEQWIPIIQLILQNPGIIKDKVSFEFSNIAQKWMTNTEKSYLFRKDIANLSLKILNDGLLESYEDEPKNQYIKSVLWAADCIPEVVDNFVKQKALRNMANHAFEELILEEGWIPICKHLPKTAVDLLEAILCEKIEVDRFGSYHILFMDLGIKNTIWTPPTYMKGPFLIFLRLHPDKGLELINRITNHATQCWKMREELEWGRKPIPQTIKLEGVSINVYGDEHVYQWYRYPTVAPNAINCALMALEYWMNEQIKNKHNPKEIFEKVLRETESVAIVGVCSSVALANKNLCLEAVIPILENPSFWMMDIHRVTKDMTAEGFVLSFSRYFSRDYDKEDNDILIKLARQPHRKIDIRSFVLPLMLYGSNEASKRLQIAIRTFPENPPFFFEHEKKDQRLVQERIETCKIWSTQVELKNYETFETGVEGQIGIRFTLPKELEEQQKEKSKIIEKRNKFFSFQGWSIHLLNDGEIGQAFTIQSAIEYAKDLVRQDDPSYQPQNFLEDSEQQAQAIAAFIAALIIHQWQWVEKNDYVSWCREQLLIATKRPEPPASSYSEVSIFPMDYRRSAARALPILLSRNPRDNEVRKAIFELSVHKSYEVKAYLFNALEIFWIIDANVVWKCISSIIKESRKKAIDRKLWYLRKQSGKLPIRLRPKPLRNCSANDIDSHHLQSILYCLPLNIQITEIRQPDKFTTFVEELLLFTINSYISYQEKGSRNKWAYNDWNSLFFPVLANALLKLPKDVAENRLCNHITNNWERAPAIMEELLRQVLLSSKPETENRFIELWLYMGDQVLSSFHHKPYRYFDHGEMKDILGLLIFTDPSGIIKWNIHEWGPLSKMTHFINDWCNSVGHHPDCFPSLVILLKTIGFSLIPEFGIAWLYNCIVRIDDRKEFFKRSRIASLLAEVLYDSWSKQETTIKQSPEKLKYFTFLVDIVAEQGESVAVLLQSRIFTIS